ncbi:mg2+ and co2+ transporter [Lasius niger]|uniref:Mg2+ and co2+ transporter n=1 Tax=Lasius niger TaxID=67767 RepID=A0A0J7K4Y6_LASNI|nr:mg2+ and co2+ transporter [Lasius niger]
MNKYLKELGFTAFIPRYLLVRRGVVQGIPLDKPMEELVEEVNKEQPNRIKVFRAFRLRKKIRRLGNEWTSHQYAWNLVRRTSLIT